VGVDEADASQGLLAFVAPLAMALLGRRIGEVAIFRTPRGDEEIDVVAIDYP
jgi:transcription elongation factor GreB